LNFTLTAFRQDRILMWRTVARWEKSGENFS
jgi:hypothetical protein